MTARITSRQIEQFAKLVRDALTSLKLSKDGAQKILARGSVFLDRFKELILALAAEYFLLLSNDKAVAWIVEYGKKSETEARQIVNGFRSKAREQGIADNVKIHALVHPGCLFKRDMPLMGPCWEEFASLQDWDFPDPPTEHCLVSWVPAPLAESTTQNVAEQTATLAAFKTTADLPSWYEVSFGSATHVGGISLAHYQATGKDPFAGLVVRTDICSAGGRRFRLLWRKGRLYCDDCSWGDGRYNDLAVFALGVVKALGPSGTRR